MVQKYKKTRGRKNPSNLLFGFKTDACGIHAIPFSGNSGTIIKNMTLMTATVRADDFNAQHSQTGVFAIFDCTFNALIVTGPSATAVKFRFTAVKGLIAAPTIVCSCFVMSVVLSTVWKFCSLLAENSVFFIRKKFTPLFIRPVERIVFTHWCRG